MPARSARSKTSQSPKKSVTNRPTKGSKSKRQQKGEAASPGVEEDDLDFNESSSDDAGDVYTESASAKEDEDDVMSMDSDALDDDESTDKSRKRKRVSPAKKASSKKSSPRKKKKDNDDESGDDFGLKEGQEVVGVVVQAPKTGRGTRVRNLCQHIT
jgi:hypothetical protein